MGVGGEREFTTCGARRVPFVAPLPSSPGKAKEKGTKETVAQVRRREGGGGGTVEREAFCVPTGMLFWFGHLKSKNRLRNISVLMNELYCAMKDCISIVTIKSCVIIIIIIIITKVLLGCVCDIIVATTCTDYT